MPNILALWKRCGPISWADSVCARPMRSRPPSIRHRVDKSAPWSTCDHGREGSTRAVTDINAYDDSMASWARQARKVAATSPSRRASSAIADKHCRALIRLLLRSGASHPRMCAASDYSVRAGTVQVKAVEPEGREADRGDGRGVRVFVGRGSGMESEQIDAKIRVHTDQLARRGTKRSVLDHSPFESVEPVRSRGYRQKREREGSLANMARPGLMRSQADPDDTFAHLKELKAKQTSSYTKTRGGKPADSKTSTASESAIAAVPSDQTGKQKPGETDVPHLSTTSKACVRSAVEKSRQAEALKRRKTKKEQAAQRAKASETKFLARMASARSQGAVEGPIEVKQGRHANLSADSPGQDDAIMESAPKRARATRQSGRADHRHVKQTKPGPAEDLKRKTAQRHIKTIATGSVCGDTEQRPSIVQRRVSPRTSGNFETLSDTNKEALVKQAVLEAVPVLEAVIAPARPDHAGDNLAEHRFDINIPLPIFNEAVNLSGEASKAVTLGITRIVHSELSRHCLRLLEEHPRRFRSYGEAVDYVHQQCYDRMLGFQSISPALYSYVHNEPQDDHVDHVTDQLAKDIVSFIVGATFDMSKFNGLRQMPAFAPLLKATDQAPSAQLLAKIYEVQSAQILKAVPIFLEQKQNKHLTFDDFLHCWAGLPYELALDVTQFASFMLKYRHPKKS
ncbi:uncharacterized protein L969DRAFT_95868 [Mixia osmundae IAM 14324]|uniref:Uncharacterized protein n=1 Tax=Mixia osmundae (strain CBS 9802 / IAM 14324 / JCM 22182 / KY 12970) TaxID=764103 RepID=G7DSB9_MIXOS|nr:uncharacterized protein L969DRAFT_95868 [Mixia osmundae IAM 14324]KEI38024.1 hypothetical protein L969DRAFT_95868 [Mixia osmundae IAM 14324]GAA93479.1 hypothetical protein E5Q_00120 [Mixia osmundae IAM 14324]